MGEKLKIKDLSIGFIGGGRITRLLLEALNGKDKLPAIIWVSDTNPESLQNLKDKYPIIETFPSDNSKPASCDLVFLALHPPAIAPVLDEIKDKVKPSAFFVSLAPKWKITQISVALGGFHRIMRMIPNAPSIVNEGYNPVAFFGTLSADEKNDIMHLFKTFGDSPEVDEEKLEAYAILSAMGPTYFWFQLQKLRELGGSFGLTNNETDKALYEMIKGAAKTLFKSGLLYDEVINLIPVKPLAEEEQIICNIYETKLKGLYEKLKA